MAVARNASPHTSGSLLSSSSIALTPKNMLTYPTTPANVCSQLLTLPKNWNGIMSMIAATRIIGRYTASYRHAAEVSVQMSPFYPSALRLIQPE